jgi:hypothetical protein
VRLVRDKMNSPAGISLILAWTHLVEGTDDMIPDMTVMAMNPEDTTVIKGLMESLTGTAGIKMEGGKEGPKA